jgi:hypothetical protein
VPPIYIDFLAGLFSRKFFLVVGCEEQSRQILAGDPQGRKGLFKHSETKEEKLGNNIEFYTKSTKLKNTLLS